MHTPVRTVRTEELQSQSAKGSPMTISQRLNATATAMATAM
jgi:hypothetical protein